MDNCGPCNMMSFIHSLVSGRTGRVYIYYIERSSLSLYVGPVPDFSLFGTSIEVSWRPFECCLRRWLICSCCSTSSALRVRTFDPPNICPRTSARFLKNTIPDIPRANASVHGCALDGSDFSAIVWLFYLPSVLWRCWLGDRKGIRPVKTEWWGVGMVICLEQGVDLHMARLMPLPLTVSCFSEIQIGFISLVPAHPDSPRKGLLNVCVCLIILVIQHRLFLCGLFTSVGWLLLLFAAFSRRCSTCGREGGGKCRACNVGRRPNTSGPNMCPLSHGHRSIRRRTLRRIGFQLSARMLRR